MKSRGGKSQRREDKKKEDQKRESLRRKKIQVRENRETLVFFPMIIGSGGSKSRLAKAVGAEPAGQMRDEKLHAVVVRSTFGSEKAKNTSRKVHAVVARSTFPSQNVKKKNNTSSAGPLLEVEDIENVHAVAARSTFASEKAKNTSRSEHFLKLRCRKSARRCGAKHICK